MIPCNIITHIEDVDERGRFRHTCDRCGRDYYQFHHHKDWRGDRLLCKKPPRWWEIGWILMLELSAIGITVVRYNRLLSLLKLKPCKCRQRAESLNTAGQWIEQKLRALITRKPL